MEKTIFIDKDRVRIELNEINNFKEILNKVYQILSEFGVDDPEAAKNPLEAVQKKLKESMKLNNLFEPEPVKIADFIGKTQQYKELQEFNKIIVGSPYLNQLRWNKTSFSLKGNVTKEITERASVILKDEKQIELANRIESFIDEANNIANELGIKLIPMHFIRSLPVLKYIKGNIVINHRVFIDYSTRS